MAEPDVIAMPDPGRHAPWLATRPAARSRCKRVLDLAISAPALIFLMPMLLAIGILIRIESPGPALFRQRRGGLHGRPFVILKFRTMRTTEDGDKIIQATRDDERVTRIGAWLRRTSLDELPQLLNVLRGDMSIVGPRPHALAHDQIYIDMLDGYRRRAEVKPGLTGLAQVRGLRGSTAEIEAMAARLDCDLDYIDQWTLGLDVKLILTTAKVIFEQESAY